MTEDPLVAKFRLRERGALARLLTFIENDNPRADAILDEVHESTGSAQLIGITGPPGAGKSTLVNQVIKQYRAQGVTVGVLAVDPSSTLTGGATLGDRVRMLETYADDGVFIRSMATRGQYGGLALATGCATQALDAFGFEVILLETVGVGQDEVDIAAAADTTILLQVPGLGDSVQAIKAGILEIADIIVVNKSDLPHARVLQRDLRSMIRYRGHLDWTPPIVPTGALDGSGVETLLAEIQNHRRYLDDSGQGELRRRRRIRDEIRRLARSGLEQELLSHLDSELGSALVDKAVNRQLTPGAAANRLLEQIKPAT